MTELETLRAALEEIIKVDTGITWTATKDNPESHWEQVYGPKAKIALKALGRKVTHFVRPELDC